MTVKIKKNLSDADMFRGMEEEESFETALLSDDIRRVKLRKKSSAIKKEAEAMMLPPETIEKLNRCLLEVSMEWLKDKGGDVDWKVVREGTSIIIKPAPAKKKVRSLIDYSFPRERCPLTIISLRRRLLFVYVAAGNRQHPG